MALRSYAGALTALAASEASTQVTSDLITLIRFARTVGIHIRGLLGKAIVYHIQNQLEEQPDMSEGDRRALLETAAGTY